MTMGDRLKELRLQKNLSQEAVARAIGITRSAYSHYEINNRQPVYETLIKLAFFFHVTTDYIIEGETRQQEAGLAREETQELLRLLNHMDEDKRKASIDKMLSVLRESE